MERMVSSEHWRSLVECPAPTARTWVVVSRICERSACVLGRTTRPVHGREHQKLSQIPSVDLFVGKECMMRGEHAERGE